MDFTSLHRLATCEIAVTARIEGVCSCTKVCISYTYIYIYKHTHTHTRQPLPEESPPHLSSTGPMTEAKCVWLLPAEVSGIIAAKIAPCVQSSLHTQPCTRKGHLGERCLRQSLYPRLGNFVWISQFRARSTSHTQYRSAFFLRGVLDFSFW